MAAPGGLELLGGGAGNRTPALDIAIVALYQLSYTPEGACRLARRLFRPDEVVRSSQLALR